MGAARETIVLLHGFAGTHRAWDAVVRRLDSERYTPLIPDLRGHGDCAGRRPSDIDGCVADALALAPDSFVLCGYSLGGRIALHAALAAVDRVTRLVLVSTTAGIEDESERAARRDSDDALAARMAGDSIAAFAADWMAQPLFAGTPPAARASWERDLMRNDPGALAAALRAMSAGRMLPLWDRLGELTMPVTVVVGETDTTYRAHGERLVGALPDAKLVVVGGAGHGLPREAPERLAAAISA